jgi:hypothetical protein
MSTARAPGLSLDNNSFTSPLPTTKPGPLQVDLMSHLPHVSTYPATARNHKRVLLRPPSAVVTPSCEGAHIVALSAASASATKPWISGAGGVLELGLLLSVPSYGGFVAGVLDALSASRGLQVCLLFLCCSSTHAELHSCRSSRTRNLRAFVIYSFIRPVRRWHAECSFRLARTLGMFLNLLSRSSIHAELLRSHLPVRVPNYMAIISLIPSSTPLST